jgi:hypothetical protein
MNTFSDSTKTFPNQQDKEFEQDLMDVYDVDKISNVISKVLDDDSLVDIALGNENVALGNENVALGNENVALGNENVALGNENVALGNENVALGNENVALGNENVALGNENVALGNESESFDDITDLEIPHIFEKLKPETDKKQQKQQKQQEQEHEEYIQIDQRHTSIKILEDYIKEHSTLAVQGSDEWLNDRKFIIGGSELSSIVGCNPYSTIHDLIAQKIGLKKFTGSSATRWGNLFEDMTELIFKTMFLEHDIKIYSTGSIPHKTILNHRYSPDGLTVIKIGNTYKITLLEFKAPYSGVPTSKVPPHYLPQVKAGLCTIDIVESCIFVNNMFRKCSINQLDFSIDYSDYHRDSEAKLKHIHKAIANGIILVSIKKENIDILLKRYKLLVTKTLDSLISTNLTDRTHSCDSDDSDDVVYDPSENTVHKHEFAPKDGELSEDDNDSDNDNDNNTNMDTEKSSENNTHNKLMKELDEFMLTKFYKIYENYAYNKKHISFKNLIDFGEEKRDMFDQFLELYKEDGQESFLDITYIKPQLNKDLFTSMYNDIRSIQRNKSIKNCIIPEELNCITKKSNLKKICVKYDFNKIINAFISNCNKKGSIPIGYLPWKLLRSSNIMVPKDTEFLHDIKDKIDNTILIVKEALSKNLNSDAKADFLEEKFPDNEVSKQYYNNKPLDYESYKDFL